MIAIAENLTSALSIEETDVIEDSERFRSIAKDGTCSWITNQKWFMPWLLRENEEPHVLWISGPPAAGKSVLASFIVDTIRKQWGDDFCQYHSFVFSDKSKRSASYLLRSLAYQAARGLSPFRAKLLRMSDRFGISFSSMSATALWEKIFRGALFNTTLGKTLYWVIDGLDESEPEAIPMIFQCLRGLDPQLRLKILLVSRPTTDITMRVRQLPQKCTAHQLSVLDTYNDIRAYVEDAVGCMIPKEVATGQRIVDKVLTKAAGNFLWVSLATKNLEKSWHRQSNIDQTLSGFPGEMTPWYSRMMQKIEGDPNEETRSMASIFLTWATYAFRPLHIVEMKVALQAEFPDLTSLEDTIHNVCGDFVHVRGSRVNLVHETARYFLVNNHPGTIVSTKAANRHEYLAILCLRHLSSTRERQWRQLLNGVGIRRLKEITQGSLSSALHEVDPFLTYAATSWPYHLSLSKPDSQPLRDVLSEFFKNDALTWINALALLGDLKSLIRAAQYLKSFIKSREKILSENVPKNFESDDIEFAKLWAIDLIKLVGKFGSYLVQHPSSIYKLIPPFCPTNSILRKTFGHGCGMFSVTGISSTEWDDCHARLSVGAETATKVIATSEVFAALVPQAHSLVVWHAETCEELRRLRHGEYVTEVAVNRKEDLVCTSGYHTIKVWELSTGRQIGCVNKHSDDRVLAVAFGTQDNEILVGYQDHLIVCQNWKTEKVMYAFRAAKGDHGVHHGLRVVSFSPDGTQLAAGSRSRPVDLWDLGTQSWIKRCLMSEETSHVEEDVFQGPEVIQWHPNSPNIYILYHNTTLIDWNPVFDEQTEHKLGAKGLVCSPCGNYLLTSDHDGSVKVYGLPDYSRSEKPDFRPIYHLEYHDYVLDLAFSPDGQRLYDLRGPVCSVWEPEALVPAERPDAEEDRSSSSGSLWVIETKKSMAMSHIPTIITAITCAPNDRGFCCGRDDGSLAIHDMTTGKKARSLPGHITDMAIIALAWSSSGNWVASGDDSGHVLVRKVQMPTATNAKLTVYKPSEFRIKDDGVNQLLFSSNDKYLLVSTLSADRIWDVSAKEICKIRKHTSPRRIKWIEHPKDPSRLVSIDAGEVHIFDWNEFVDLTTDKGLQFVRTSQDTVTGKRKIYPIPSSFARLNLGQHKEEDEIVSYITQSNDKRSIIFETLPCSGHDRDRLKRRRIELIRTVDVDPNTPQCQIILQNSVQELAREVSKLVGSYQNQVVFFNHQHWLCTWEIGTAVGSYKRHLFLPKDWVNSETLSLNVLSDHGTLLCPRNGEVAIIKNGIKF
jgi:WD40 repeat protein